MKNHQEKWWAARLARSSGKVKIVSRGDRGFHGYGEEQVCTYGSRIDVYESSAASGPHVWLSVEVSTPGRTSGAAHAHLNEEQARVLIARLRAWLDEIPARWGKGK